REVTAAAHRGVFPSGVQWRPSSRGDPVPEGARPLRAAPALRNGDACRAEAAGHVHARCPPGPPPVGEPPPPHVLLESALLATSRLPPLWLRRSRCPRTAR